jgi:hypothetical protein
MKNTNEKRNRIRRKMNPQYPNLWKYPPHLNFWKFVGKQTWLLGNPSCMSVRYSTPHVHYPQLNSSQVCLPTNFQKFKWGGYFHRLGYWGFIFFFFFISVYFVLFSLISFCFRWFRFISLISFRFVSFLLISFRFVSFRFVFVDSFWLSCNKLSKFNKWLLIYHTRCLSGHEFYIYHFIGKLIVFKHQNIHYDRVHSLTCNTRSKR